MRWFALIIACAFFVCAPPAHAQSRAYEITARAGDLAQPASLASASVAAETPVTWDVYAPPAAERAPGVMIFISPIDAWPAPERWRPVLDAHNLVWIAARQSGNEILPERRILFALMGLAALQRERALDSERFYITGFSGGGRTASIAAMQFPGVFHGAIYFSGANWHRPSSTERFAAARANRFVFITGASDFNRDDTRRVLGRYGQAEINNTLLLDLHYLAHQLPRHEDLDRALTFLDQR
jgi:hypothetical protein